MAYYRFRTNGPLSYDEYDLMVDAEDDDITFDGRDYRISYRPVSAGQLQLIRQLLRRGWLQYGRRGSVPLYDDEYQPGQISEPVVCTSEGLVQLGYYRD